jgi:Tol biopolymer transport system component
MSDRISQRLSLKRWLSFRVSIVGVITLAFLALLTACSALKPTSLPSAHALAFIDAHHRILLVDSQVPIQLVDISALFPDLYALSIHDWSPDGQRALYTAARNYCPQDNLADGGCVTAHDVYLVKPDGTATRRLTSDSTRKSSPTWTPDNRRLLYSISTHSQGFLVEGTTDIFSLDVTTGITTQLTHADLMTDAPPHGAYNGSPLPSPDGTHILFSSYRDGEWEYYLMNPDGSNQVRLTNLKGGKDLASWSPDGKRILWSHMQPPSLMVLDLATKAVSDLGTRELQACDGHWSPDGKHIAFVANCESSDGKPGAIYVMDADGSKKQNLTSGIDVRCFSLRGWVPGEWMAKGTPVSR